MHIICIHPKGTIFSPELRLSCRPLGNQVLLDFYLTSKGHELDEGKLKRKEGRKKTSLSWMSQR